jgi:hypothetical protein
MIKEFLEVPRHKLLTLACIAFGTLPAAAIFIFSFFPYLFRELDIIRLFLFLLALTFPLISILFLCIQKISGINLEKLNPELRNSVDIRITLLAALLTTFTLDILSFAHYMCPFNSKTAIVILFVASCFLLFFSLIPEKKAKAKAEEQGENPSSQTLST